MSTSGGATGGNIERITVALDAAAIMTLHTAPTLIVPAPGANRAIQVAESVVEAAPGVVGYNNTGAIALYWGDVPGPGAQATADIGRLDMFNDAVPSQQIASSVQIQFQIDITDPIDRSVVEDAPLFFGVTNADEAVVGPVVTTVLNAGGAGYVIGDTGTIDGNLYGTPAAYVVDTVAAITGAVLTYHVTDPGNGYLPATGVTTTTAGAQPGVGTGFTVNITALHAPDGAIYVTVLYYVITLH